MVCGDMEICTAPWNSISTDVEIYVNELRKACMYVVLRFKSLLAGSIFLQAPLAGLPAFIMPFWDESLVSSPPSGSPLFPPLPPGLPSSTSSYSLVTTRSQTLLGDIFMRERRYAAFCSRDCVTMILQITSKSEL